MDRFERIKKLGEGATGTVYKAFDNTSGFLVALKVPEPAPDGIDPSMHYAREVELLKGIDHKGVVKVIDNGTENGMPWVAYEFIKGHTLRELIISGKVFTVEETVKLGRDIARALAYVHDKGIVHRDINPNNIMITTDGEVKIMDFGIALRPGEPFPKQLVGTPGYMSPETARGEVAQPESDIYSLGLILYELLTRKPAYTGNSIPEVIGKVVANDYLELQKQNLGIPEFVTNTIGKALGKNPSDRYHSAGEFADALDKIISPRTEKTPTPTAKIEKTDTIGSPPKLVCISGPYRGYSFDLGPTITTIGGEYADINLSRDPDISAQHCWIVSEGDSWWLYDAEDSGGTHVSGMAVKKAKLLHGDRITVGQSNFRWENPNEANPSRSEREIEYMPVQRGTRTGGSRQPLSKGSSESYKSVSSGGVNPVIRGFLGAIIIVLIAIIFYGFVLLPNGESKRVNLFLEDYWVDISTDLNLNTPEIIYAAIRTHEANFKIDELESFELSSSFFFNLPGPATKRRADLNKITLVIKTLETFNQLRGTLPSAELKKQIEKSRADIETIAIPDYDKWKSRQDVIVSKLKQIEAWIEAKALTEATAQNTQPQSGAAGEALKNFLDGYYVIVESTGKLSTEIAREVFDRFQVSRSNALDAIDKNKTDTTSQSLVILSDYFMVKLRTDYLTNWSTQILDDSVALLAEGRDMLEEIPDSDFSRSVPREVDDQGYRVKGRLKAKFMTLIDRFQQMTGATVPPPKNSK